jgi:tetratricopeptide (TPR) repeat protein
MTPPSIPNSIKIILAALILALTLLPMQAQEEEEEAYQYTDEEYRAWQEFQSATGNSEKIELAVKFLKQYPESALKDHILTDYQNMMFNLQNQQDWTQIIELGQKFLSVSPNDEYTISSLAASYAQINDFSGFVTFGEKVYKSTPSPQLAYGIAQAYLSMENEAKFLQWGERALAVDPDKYDIAVEMTRRYLSRENMDQASKYARISLKALPKATMPEGYDNRSWKEALNAYYFLSYYTVGVTSFQTNNFEQAISNFENALKYDRKSDISYYYIGMSNWQLNRLQPAMLNLAKAEFLNGPVVDAAKQNLEQLYKSSRRGSLEGIENVRNRARDELK